ncbi:MAG: hypothetical protein EA402_03880 [Planctomycetota bacterium]|nr:MAG: hypothetical protein EA402_03880 [Planctomycetota bacterium]
MNSLPPLILFICIAVPLALATSGCGSARNSAEIQKLQEQNARLAADLAEFRNRLNALTMVEDIHEGWRRGWDEDAKSLAAELRAANRQLNNPASTTEEIAAEEAQALAGKKALIADQAARIEAQIRQIQQLNDSLERTRQRNSELNDIAATARAVAQDLDIRLSELEEELANRNPTSPPESKDPSQ